MRRPRGHLTLPLNSPFVSVGLLRLSCPKVGRTKTNVRRTPTLPIGHPSGESTGYQPRT